MNIKPISTDIGKHKIPKYLYHLTGTENIQSIKSGGLKTGEDPFFGDGVFLFDMANWIKFWKQKFGSRTLQQRLLRYAASVSGEVALIKVPTKNLDKSELVVRRQDTLFNTTRNYDTLFEIFSANRRGEISDGILHHIQYGSPAAIARKFDGKKIPLEYIYPDKIAPEHFNIIGKGAVTREKIDFKTTMKKILTGTPEEKMLDALA